MQKKTKNTISLMRSFHSYVKLHWLLTGNGVGESTWASERTEERESIRCVGIGRIQWKKRKTEDVHKGSSKEPCLVISQHQKRKLRNIIPKLDYGQNT